MNKETIKNYKEGKFSPLQIEMAKANSFNAYPTQDYIWFDALCRAQAKSERVIINLTAGDVWPSGASESIKGTIIDMAPPKVAVEADEKNLDIACLAYVDWIMQVARPQDIIVIGRDVSRALCSRILPILEENSRKCFELLRLGENFFSFRRL
jgi:hypothetical protein